MADNVLDLRTHVIQSDEDNSDDDDDVFQTGKSSNNILVVDLKQIYTNYLNNKKQAHQARLLHHVHQEINRSVSLLQTTNIEN